MNYSDLDRMKYLNIILLTEFRNHIQRIQIQSMAELENEQTDDDQNSGQIDQDMTDGLIRRKYINSDDIEIPLVKVEEVKNSDRNMGDLEIKDIEEQNLSIDTTISADCDIQNSLDGEHIVNDDFEASIEKFEIENIENDQSLINNHDDNDLIICDICEKDFKTKILFKNHFGAANGEYVTCKNFEKTFQNKMKLDRSIKKVDGDRKDHKFESCSKYFSQAKDLSIHIHTVHITSQM